MSENTEHTEDHHDSGGTFAVLVSVGTILTGFWAAWMSGII